MEEEGLRFPKMLAGFRRCGERVPLGWTSSDDKQTSHPSLFFSSTTIYKRGPKESQVRTPQDTN
jgi:hypothetical protein